MNRKLLHKTSRAYLVYSVLILFVSAPVFYYATSRLYMKEADDTLILHKKEFLQYTATSFTTIDISNFNKFNRNTKIEPSLNLINDSIYDAVYYDTLDAELEPYRELISTITIQGKPYTYVAKVNLVESADLLKSIAFLFIITISVLLIGLFIITKRLSSKLWSPFYQTLQEIEGFEIDKSKQPLLSETGIEEFNRLNASIQKLVEKNTAIFKNQREFIENAAHELQTPLAVFQAKIDTHLQRPDITQAQSEVLGSLNENISRLNRLNKNLLLLSKMENDSYSDRQTVSLKNCVEKNLDFFTEQAKAKQLDIKMELSDEVVTSSNSILAEILISNLFLNAIKHNIQHGKIIVSTNKDKLVFSNTGLPQPLNNNKLFNRFSKTNPSEQGTGLGLSIIKKIADLNKWELTYSYSNNFHSFSVTC